MKFLLPFVAGGRVSSRRGSYFLLLRQKKVAKEKATPLSATLRFATGNLRCSGFAGSRRTRFAQTAASPDPRNPALLGAYRGAWIPNGPLLRSATKPPQARSACGGWYWLFGSDSAERSDGLSSPHPFWLRRGAQMEAGSGPQLFERSEFCGPPPESSTAGCPQRSGGTQTVGSPFFCLRFFGEAKKSRSPAGARPGLGTQTRTNKGARQ